MPLSVCQSLSENACLTVDQAFLRQGILSSTGLVACSVRYEFRLLQFSTEISYPPLKKKAFGL